MILTPPNTILNPTTQSMGRRCRGRGRGRRWGGGGRGRGSADQPQPQQEGQGQGQADDGAIHPVYPIMMAGSGGGAGAPAQPPAVALTEEERLLRFQGMLREALVDRARVRCGFWVWVWIESTARRQPPHFAFQ